MSPPPLPLPSPLLLPLLLPRFLFLLPPLSLLRLLSPILPLSELLAPTQFSPPSLFNHLLNHVCGCVRRCAFTETFPSPSRACGAVVAVRVWCAWVQDAARAAGALAAVVQALETHKGDRDVAYWGCQAVVHLAANNPVNQVPRAA